MLTRLLALVVLVVAGNVRAESVLLDSIASRFDRQQPVRAEFTQEKRIAVLNRPLQSDGRFVYSPGHGILWHIDHPYRLTYLLTDSRVVEIGPDGRRHTRSGRDMPGLTQATRVLRAILGADVKRLAEHFNLSATGAPEHWTLLLVPRTPQLGSVLGKLQIQGGDYAENIDIEETQGGVTRIRFYHLRNAPLEADERALFESRE